MSVMRSLVLVSLVFTGVSALAIQAPPFAWARVAGAAGQDYGRGFAVDTNGNSYITGSFDGNATFGNTNITSSGGNNRPDIYLAKYDAAGQLAWVRRAGGAGTDTANALALDPQGNIIIGGQSDSVPISFGTTNVTASSQKIIFAKYDSNGNVLWVRVSLSQELFPPHGGNATGAACDSAGNIYFTGVFTGKANFGGTPNTNSSVRQHHSYIVLTWPLANADFVAECTAVLGIAFGPASEPRVTNTGAGTISVTINPSGPQKFYRLARP